MIKSRAIAEELGLNMKIGDVEYQGDGGKAIFYYIADERVDFRKLIRILAEEFKVRIEMKQIGARQETGRIGNRTLRTTAVLLELDDALRECRHRGCQDAGPLDESSKACGTMCEA